MSRAQPPAQSDAFSGLTGNAQLEALLAEVAALFHRLRAEAQDLHGDGESSAGRRAVLLSLQRSGPQSVPALARARPVSRQYMQTLVNALLAAGLAEQRPNPAHKRSPLIAVTQAGQDLLAEMLEKERAALASAQLEVPGEDLDQAARTLALVRTFFESEQWRNAKQRSTEEPRE